MNNINCELARDLMPLVIDEVASASAKQAVDAHLEACDECRRIMEALRREPPARAAADADTKFIRFCRRMERGMRWRLLRWVLAAALATLMLVGCFALARYEMYEAGRDMAFETGDVRLIADRYGFLAAEFDAPKARQPFTGGWSSTASGGADGSVVLSIRPQQSAWPQLFGLQGSAHVVLPLDGLRLEDGQLVLYDVEAEYVDLGDGLHEYQWQHSSRPVGALFFGAGEGVQVYRPGDEIPYDASADEAYRDGARTREAILREELYVGG